MGKFAKKLHFLLSKHSAWKNVLIINYNMLDPILIEWDIIISPVYSDILNRGRFAVRG
jgi:hypothetical protein